MRFLAWCKYDLQSDITNLFSALYPNERNQQVVQLRAQKKTLDQIGKNFGLTRERIRQLERKMQRSFNARQARIKIISKINADKNNATIVTSADIAALCPDHLQELLFLLRGCESSNFTYDKWSYFTRVRSRTCQNHSRKSNDGSSGWKFFKNSMYTGSFAK